MIELIENHKTVKITEIKMTHGNGDCLKLRNLRIITGTSMLKMNY